MSVVCSVRGNAEGHPAGQILHEKDPQTVPAPLDNGKCIFNKSCNHVKYVHASLHTEEHLGSKRIIFESVESLIFFVLSFFHSFFIYLFLVHSYACKALM